MNSNSKFLLTLLAGVAAGVAIGYYLASDNKEEIIEDLKNTAMKIKDGLDKEYEKGKQLVDELKNSVNDLLNKV